MNFLSLFVLIPLLMTCAMFLTKDIRRIRAIMVVGASLLLGLSVALVAMYLGERSAGNGAEMLFTADAVWYAPLNIHYSVGVDGISVAMLLLSSVIVFTGVFASWKCRRCRGSFRMVLAAVDRGVQFFISIDLFTMFMFLRWR